MSEQQHSNSGLYSIIIGLLLLLSGGLGFFLWQKSKSALVEREKQQQEIEALLKEKTRIGQSLDSISVAYGNLRTENENLTSKVAASATIVQQKEAAIREIRVSTSKELEDLRQQVAKLQSMRSEMEGIVSVLKKENDDLRNENTRLTGENAQLKSDNSALTGQVTDLAKQLEEQIRKTQSATFKATSFKVELLRRDKTTGRARRARDLAVSFDLVDVPQVYHGEQFLYLVVTDDKGRPIASANPIKKSINAPAGPVEIIAIQSKQINMGPTQRHSFNYKLEERLKSGNYVVAIYCDRGLLGASSFRLS
jgi:peptidoglycan hydrolase CwlO-like protein